MVAKPQCRDGERIEKAQGARFALRYAHGCCLWVVLFFFSIWCFVFLQKNLLFGGRSELVSLVDYGTRCGLFTIYLPHDTYKPIVFT